MHMTRGTRMDFITSYVHSQARENLNAFVNFYGAVLDADRRRGPVCARRGRRAESPVPARPGDADRTVAAAGESSTCAAACRTRWSTRISSSSDRATSCGFPSTSAPSWASTGASPSRMPHPWLGLRVANALGAFLPTDVQANLGSPDFGSFYNSEYREFRIHVRFEK